MPIQVIDRAVRIIRIVARRNFVSLSEISHEAGLPVETTSRILKSLVENGILQRRDDKTYEIGVRLLPISNRLEPFRRSLEVVHPAITKLSTATREDVGLAVLQGKEAVVVDWCYGPKPPNIIEPYSREIPLYCAFGKVLIAFQPAAWRNKFLQTTQLRKLAAGTVPHRTALAEEIDRIRRSGVHVSMAENVDDAGSISVPVFDGGGKLLGALFITAPLDRLSDRKILAYRQQLFDVAADISARLRTLRAGRFARG